MQESARAKAQPTASSGPSLEPSLVVQSDALIYVVDLIHCRDLLPYELLLLTNLRNHCYEKAIGVSILAAGNGAHMALLESMGIDQLITVRSSLLEAIQAAREDRQRILQGEVPVSSIRWLIANDY